MSFLALFRGLLPLFSTRWTVQRTLYQAHHAARLCEVQVLGTGSSEVGPSLCVRTDRGRYLFNCPELFQIASKSNQVNKDSLRHIFVTKCSWDNIGGIPGITLAPKQKKNNKSHFTYLPITGPPDLKMLPEITKTFMYKKDPIHITVATDQMVVLDNIDLKVIAVELTPPITIPPTQLDELPVNDSNEQLKGHLLNVQKSDSIFAYIVQLPTIRGEFYPEKAKELGLRPRQYGQVIKGISVISSTGQKVHPHQVMAPDQTELTMLVLECPSHAYIPSLISHPFLQSSKFNPALIAHTTPRHVLECNKYQNWMNSFKDAKHVLIHSDYCPPEMTKMSYNVQLTLHLVDPDIFCLPHFVCDFKKKKSEKESNSNSSILIGQRSLKFHLRPLAKFGKVEFPDLKTRDVLISEALEGLKENPNFLKQVENHMKVKTNFDAVSLKSLDKKIPFVSSTSLTSPCRVTFLGTGSSYPTKLRGTSSILVHLPSGDYMLLDAGEGTMSQLYKCFGPSIADEILRKLKCVFISHIHSDHHLGLIGIIRKREELLNNNGDNFTHRPLVILGPQFLLNWLRNYSHFCEKIHFDFTLSKSGTPLPSVLQDTGLSHIELVPVIHTNHSKAIILYCEDQTNQYKIVYSGDTRPCRELIQAGRDASLLIHETTFHHSFHESEGFGKHTTDVEVLEVASQMKAQFLIATHFSQYYTKEKFSGTTIDMDMFGSLWSNGAAVAFDFMSIRLDELEMLRELNPIMHDVLTSLVIKDFEEDVY